MSLIGFKFPLFIEHSKFSKATKKKNQERYSANPPFAGYCTAKLSEPPYPPIFRKNVFLRDKRRLYSCQEKIRNSIQKAFLVKI